MTTRYFFGKKEEGAVIICTFATMVNETFLWRVSWQRDPGGKKLPEHYRIESGRVDASVLEELRQLEEIEEENISKHVGIEKDFLSWALSGYRNFLSRNE